MMEANEYQIGGTHYQGEYQHWDFVCDTDMPYLLGCATKYISRWKEKNGVEDLRKAIHYLQKANERGITLNKKRRISDWAFPSIKRAKVKVRTEAFVYHLPFEEAEITWLIVEGHYEKAIKMIGEIILDETNSTEEDCGPTANYVDPDNNYFRG